MNLKEFEFNLFLLGWTKHGTPFDYSRYEYSFKDHTLYRHSKENTLLLYNYTKKEYSVNTREFHTALEIIKTL